MKILTIFKFCSRIHFVSILFHSTDFFYILFHLFHSFVHIWSQYISQSCICVIYIYIYIYMSVYLYTIILIVQQVFSICRLEASRRVLSQILNEDSQQFHLCVHFICIKSMSVLCENVNCLCTYVCILMHIFQYTDRCC